MEVDTIEELIEILQGMQARYGNTKVRVQSISHEWKPDPTPRRVLGTEEQWYILLNP